MATASTQEKSVESSLDSEVKAIKDQVSKSAQPKRNAASTTDLLEAELRQQQDALDPPLPQSSATTSATLLPNSQVSVEELLKKMAETEAELARVTAERDEAREQAEAMSNRRVSKSEPLRIKGSTYLFEVGPVKAKDYPHLPVVQIETIDESEAIRWYAATHEHPPQSGRQVDLVAVKMQARCIDPKRAQAIMIQKQISILRQKVEQNQALTEREQQMVQEFHEKIYGIASL